MAKIKKPRMTKEQKAENKRRSAFAKQIRDIFIFSGFDSISTKGWQFHLGGRFNELDHLFIYENVVIICEDTLRFLKDKDKAVSLGMPFNRNHKAEKEETARIIFENKKAFFELLKKREPSNDFLNKYSCHELKVFYLYFDYTTQHYSEDDVIRCEHMLLIDKPTFNYFSLMSKSIKSSFKYELFRFLDLHEKDIGAPDPAGSRNIKYIETPIIYPDKVTGYKDEVRMVSFMMKPGDLINYSYVLRKDGWDQKTDLYQRLITPKRIKSIREYVAENETTFLNNIIVTLPPNVKFYKRDGDITIETSIQEITTFETDLSIQIPVDFNSIGIIDGQHRVFAFYEESDKNDKVESKISALRDTLSLLVTGIIYPTSGKYADENEKRKFESNLFVTINKNAKPVDPDTLIQVQAIMNPTSGEAISRKVIEKLNKSEPFQNMFQLSKTETAPIKTASIIKYALSSLLNAKNSSDSLYSYWLAKENKGDGFVLANSNDIRDYVDYCSKRLKEYFKAVQNRFISYWDGESKLLKVISINAFIIAFRDTLGKLGGPQSYDFYREAFAKINVNFSKDNYAFQYAGAQYSMFAKNVIIPAINKTYEEKNQ